MLSHELLPAIFKIDTKHFGSSKLILNTQGLNIPSENETCLVPLDLKLSIADQELLLNSVLFLDGEKSKIQLQLLEDEMIGEDGLDFTDCANFDIEDQYKGRTDEQIDEIEKEILHAELNGGEEFFLSGCDLSPQDEPFLTIDEAFLQPIFLDSSWQEVYNLNHKKTENSAESASQTKELYFKIESILNEWLATQLKFS